MLASWARFRNRIRIVAQFEKSRPYPSLLPIAVRRGAPFEVP